MLSEQCNMTGYVMRSLPLNREEDCNRRVTAKPSADAPGRLMLADTSTLSTTF